jgi:hypothetical protein
MKYILAVIILTLAFAGSAVGQTKAADAKPTYKQTSEWIAAKLADEGGFSFSTGSGEAVVASSESYSDISMEGCSLRFTGTLSSASTFDPPDRFISKTTIPLSKVASVEVYDIKIDGSEPYQGVLIKTVADDITSKLTQEKNGKTIISDTDQPRRAKDTIALGKSPEPNIASRMQKALTHVVDLCKQSPSREVF